MKGAPRIMKTVKVIMTELESVELYEGQGKYPELKQWLEAQGFRMIAANFAPEASTVVGKVITFAAKCYRMIATNFDPAKEGILVGDAVFARE